MRAAGLRADGGQVLVLAALSMLLLLGALALTADWGYGFAVRRSLQSGADAAALGVGRTLATSTVVVGGTLRFMPSDATLWNRASGLAAANYGSLAGVAMTLEYGTATPAWTASQGASSSAAVPDSTVYVRVRLSLSYRSLFASLIGSSQVNSAASSRVRLSGAATPLTPTFALAPHFSSGMFSTTCPSPCTSPSTADPVTLWTKSGTRWGKFRGAVDLSRYSHEHASSTTQLVADWDRTGSVAAGTPLKNDHGGNCTNDLWDTAGNEDNGKQNQDCSVINWFYYGYGGSLSLTSDYRAVVSPREAPTTFPAASQTWCALSDATWLSTNGYIPNPRAACDRGDWVETVESDLDKDMPDALVDRIAAGGATGLLSSRIVPAGGPHPGDAYGKALTVMVLLWDCGEEYRKNDPAGSQWQLIFPTGPSDCTNAPAGSGAATPQRVHLMTVAPFTFYEGLVDNDILQGFWGGAFGTPPPNAPTPLWVFSNTAYLVSDE